MSEVKIIIKLQLDYELEYTSDAAHTEDNVHLMGRGSARTKS